jgi:hypothetical protein
MILGSAQIRKFETRRPSPQTVVDLFAGDWASDLSRIIPVEGTGKLDLFTGDLRPRIAADHLGYNGQLEGFRVLELGPLEGAHSYGLERLGADVTAIESNSEAYLKCLVVKEIMGLRARLLLGDAIAYMRECLPFEMVFCSGILYHMADPLELIEAICGITDRCFVWTHYYNDENGNAEGQRRPRAVSRGAATATYYELGYDTAAQDNPGFWGGNQRVRAWMPLPDIIAAFRAFGLDEIVMVHDDPHIPIGATASFAARRMLLAAAAR